MTGAHDSVRGRCRRSAATAWNTVARRDSRRTTFAAGFTAFPTSIHHSRLSLWTRNTEAVQRSDPRPMTRWSSAANHSLAEVSDGWCSCLFPELAIVTLRAFTRVVPEMPGTLRRGEVQVSIGLTSSAGPENADRLGMPGFQDSLVHWRTWKRRAVLIASPSGVDLIRFGSFCPAV